MNSPIAKYRTLLLTALILLGCATTINTASAQSKNKKSKKSENPSKSEKSKDANDTIAPLSQADSAEIKAEDLIDKAVRGEAEPIVEPPTFADKKRGLPSRLWYGYNFTDAYVKKPTITIDSMPDEITITVVKDYSEFCFPVKNVITSPYGWRDRWDRPHRGVDIALNTGDPVRCAFPGVVRIAKTFGGYGNLIVVRHYNGLETVYGHLSKINVKQYQIVKAGDIIGRGGSTGHSTGPHLHFEVRFQYEAIDPEWILDFKTHTLRTRTLYLNKSYFGITKTRNKNNITYKADKSIIKERELPQKGANKKKQEFYISKRGDTLEKIAKKHKVSLTQLKSLNPDLPNKPDPGTEIRVH